MGGFPDGKGFAVSRRAYEKVGGIEIFYQLEDQQFVCHLSDDWDFGIKVRASGEEIVFAPRSQVRINPRRVIHSIQDMLDGVSYGKDGLITMKNIRPTGAFVQEDITESQAQQLFANALIMSIVILRIGNQVMLIIILAMVAFSETKNYFATSFRLI